MSYNVFGSGWGSSPQAKRKVFISYHHGGDQGYYDMFTRAFCDTYEVIADNSLERRVDSLDVDYVMRRIRENYIAGTFMYDCPRRARYLGPQVRGLGDQGYP